MSNAILIERAADAVTELVMDRGLTTAQALAAVSRRREFRRIAGLLRKHRQQFIDFAWDMCG